jgi:hypothetical protein
MRSIFASLAAALVLASGCASPRHAAGSASGAVIQSMSGSAELSNDGNTWKRARANQRVTAGTTVRTSPNSLVNFHLGEYGGVLTLHPESTITFEQIGPASPAANVVAIANLTRGRVTGDTLKLPENTKIVVKTLSGVHEIP